ncbi:MAG: hypothetical protein ACLFR2_09375 [Candidatus Kapaibacterium sp.]
MEFTRLIHDFVDGSLDKPYEDRLFAEMASSRELRKELKEFIEFEKAAKADYAAFAPSANLTMGVFGALGIGAGAAAGTAAAGAAKAGFFTKFGSAIISSVAASLVTATVMFFAMSGGSSENEISTASGGRQLNQGDTDIPLVSSQESDDNSRTELASKSRNSLKNDQETSVYSARLTPESGINAGTTAKTADNQKADVKSKYRKNNKTILSDDPRELFLVYKSNETNYTQEPNHENKIFVSRINTAPISRIDEIHHGNTYGPQSDIYTAEGPEYNLDIGFFGKNDFFLEVKAGEYWSFPGATMERSSEPFFENGSVLLLYKFSDQFSAGIDLRQEFFFMDYEGRENNTRYKYEQHTNLMAAGITARYKVFEALGTDNFLQASLAGNEVGQIGRIMYGLQFSPGYDYRFTFGVEGSLLRYEHAGNEFLSPKIGFHYGVTFIF